MSKRQAEGVIVISSLEEDMLTALMGQRLYGLELLEVLNRAREKQGMRKLSIGSLYPTLKRLEEQKLIVGEWGEEVSISTSGNRRRYYTILSDGQIAISRTQAYRRELAKREEEISLPEGQSAFILFRWFVAVFSKDEVILTKEV